MGKIAVVVNAEDPSLLPMYGSEGASGADVKAHLKEPIELHPQASLLIPTGLRFEIPQGYEIQVRPRSGLALKEQITVLNTPGTIDWDYRGELKVILINHGKKSFLILPGMRIAQIVIAAVSQGDFILGDVLINTTRGEGGFGHTGV